MTNVEKTISASELKNSLGAVLREVRQEDEIRVIEQRGVPAAAIISIDDLRLLRDAKKRQRQEHAGAMRGRGFFVGLQGEGLHRYTFVTDSPWSTRSTMTQQIRIIA